MVEGFLALLSDIKKRGGVRHPYARPENSEMAAPGPCPFDTQKRERRKMKYARPRGLTCFAVFFMVLLRLSLRQDKGGGGRVAW